MATKLKTEKNDNIAQKQSKLLLSISRYHEQQAKQWSSAIGGPRPEYWVRRHRLFAKVCKDASREIVENNK